MPTQSSDRRPERSQASFYSTAPIILADRPCRDRLTVSTEVSLVCQQCALEAVRYSAACPRVRRLRP